MSKKIILILSPLIIFIEIVMFNWIVELVRQPSDIAVMVGVLFMCITLGANYILFKTIQKQFKTK